MPRPRNPVTPTASSGRHTNTIKGLTHETNTHHNPHPRPNPPNSRLSTNPDKRIRTKQKPLRASNPNHPGPKHRRRTQNKRRPSRQAEHAGKMGYRNNSPKRQTEHKSRRPPATAACHSPARRNGKLGRIHKRRPASDSTRPRHRGRDMDRSKQSASPAISCSHPHGSFG